MYICRISEISKTERIPDIENYIVSARKYRPSTFESVVGQRALTTTLKNAIATQKLAHAYLFCGPRGVGKTTCARIFAKTINCMTPTADGEACNQCESCVAFNEQRSYNIHELDAASNNSVDDIRQLVEQVRIPPQIGKYKVYIIDEVHMLSASAFNAFLKTLEEPPRHAIFILATTEKHKILPTILSRCQIYDFNRISVEDTVNHLSYVASKEGITAEPEALNAVLEAGTWAPTGMGRQSPVIVCIQNKADRDTLSKMNAAAMGGNGDPFYGAPCVAVVLVDKTIPTCVEDGSLVMGNMLNAAESVGLSACWIHRAKEMFETAEGQALLKKWGVPNAENLRGVGNCILGYAAEGGKKAPAPRKENYVVLVK